jgi:hypothetical protein
MNYIRLRDEIVGMEKIHIEKLPNVNPSRTVVKSEVVRVHNEGLSYDVWGTRGVDPRIVNLDAPAVVSPTQDLPVPVL